MQAKVIAKPTLGFIPKEPSFEILHMREYRDAVGLTLQQLADLTGLSRSYIHDIETGRRAAPQSTASIISGILDKAWEDKCQTKRSHAKK